MEGVGVITPQTDLLDIELQNSRVATGDLIIEFGFELLHMALHVEKYQVP